MNQLVKLRTEIIESQKSQDDFLKWKLISVAAIGALALSLKAVRDPPRQFSDWEVR